ncbi:MAG: SDR family oxidoreductase [SAR324 cluster bacterium]|nr:SDR family oxidoreductase [SAR324 cluster bacterium]
MTGRLDNEHILVIGGGRGIGSAIVKKCLLEGAKVSFIDLVGEEVRSLNNKLNQDNKLLFEEGNVCSVEDLKRWCDASRKKFGAITGLVNNAGRNSYADPVTMTEQQWEDVFDVDLKAAWLTAREVLPDMIANKKGSIVNIASVHANMTYPSMFPYAAAKSGLVGLTRSMALEVGAHQVRVNALSPGYTETFLVKEFFERNDPSLREKVMDVHPMHRMAKPSEIANCVAFLLSTEASFVTGANWIADGGLTSRFAG